MSKTATMLKQFVFKFHYCECSIFRILQYSCLHKCNTSNFKLNTASRPLSIHCISSRSHNPAYNEIRIQNIPSSMTFCRLRFYSNSKHRNSDSDGINKGNIKHKNKDTKIIDYDGKTYKVEYDPWIKSLLADIQKDFKLDDDVDVDDSSYEKQKVSNNKSIIDSYTEIEPSKNFNSERVQDVNYEYDYEIAEDIEEYDYFDESGAAEDTKKEKYVPIPMSRGKSGVFELDELLTLMEHLGADHVVNIPIPPEANYCDNMIIATAKSQRHLQALNNEMLWIHKRKKSKKDPVLRIEGLEKSDWCAMDLGNLVLHIFLNEEVRQYYDIESLWLLGPENDPKCRDDDQPSSALTAEELYWLEIGGKQGEEMPRQEGS